MALEGDVGAGLVAIGAGLAVGLAGDMSLFGKALMFTVLPETIVIFGLVISILCIFVM